MATKKLSFIIIHASLPLKFTQEGGNEEWAKGLETNWTKVKVTRHWWNEVLASFQYSSTETSDVHWRTKYLYFALLYSSWLFIRLKYCLTNNFWKLERTIVIEKCAYRTTRKLVFGKASLKKEKSRAFETAMLSGHISANKTISEFSWDYRKSFGTEGIQMC